MIDARRRVAPRARRTACLLCLPLAAAAQPAPEAAVNRMGLASGVVPLHIEAEPAARVGPTQALRIIDGAAQVFVLTSPVAPQTRVALVYELPAPTTFERFVVPQVLETPSPTQTFVRDIVVHGSAVSARDGFQRLAAGTLAVHEGKGRQTVLAVESRVPVRWVRVELSQGLDVRTPKVVLEFSELLGHGEQAPVPLSTRFDGRWQGRGVAVTLRQQGPLVSGCYDRGGVLEGTVSGNVLSATGITPGDGVRSAFVAVVDSAGALLMLRSSNGSPFAAYAGEPARGAAGQCPQPKSPSLGCGAVVHGIRFEFDSARLRPESSPLLDALQAGLAAERSARIRIEGHTSSEGEAAYNQRLSEQRAQAVVDALVQRGLARTRLAASGAGEARPIAPNDEESGRAVNRRVEVHCLG